MKTTLVLEQAKNLFSWPMPRKGIFLATLAIAMTASTILALVTRNNNPVPAMQQQNQVTESLVAERLDAFHRQLESIEETARKPLPEINLSGITEQIASLSKSINELREADKQHLTQTLSQTEAALGQELHSIKEVVNHLDAKKSPVKYLSPRELPFAIVSIDSIQQVPVASVAYDYKTIPMEKGDSLAGWKIVSVDYSRQRIELENAKSERIVVTQDHIG